MVHLIVPNKVRLCNSFMLRRPHRSDFWQRSHMALADHAGVQGASGRPRVLFVLAAGCYAVHAWLSMLTGVSRPAGSLVARQHIGQPCSAPVVFDSTCRQAYTVTLRGTVRATTCVGSLGGDAELLWSASAGAPVISAPAFLPVQQSLVVATVRGCVRCFSCARGRLPALTDVVALMGHTPGCQ